MDSVGQVRAAPLELEKFRHAASYVTVGTPTNASTWHISPNLAPDNPWEGRERNWYMHLILYELSMLAESQRKKRTQTLTVIHVGEGHARGQTSQNNRQNRAVAPWARVPDVDVVPSRFLWEYAPTDPSSEPVVWSDMQ